MKRFKFLSFANSILIYLFILTSALIISVKFKPIYIHDANNFYTSETNISSFEAKYNYTSIVDNYLSLKSTNSNSSTFLFNNEMNEQLNAIHNYYLIIFTVCALSFVISLLLLLYLKRRYKYASMIIGPMLSVITTLVFVFLINFIKVNPLSRFKSIIINNNYSSLNLNKTLISLIPNNYLSHLLLFTMLIIYIISIIYIILYWVLRKTNPHKF